MPYLKSDLSAQFGGTDGSSRLLPFFWLFKKEVEDRALGAPIDCIEILSFIWRAGGKFIDYDFFGCEAIDYAPKDKYISIDIGIPREFSASATEDELRAYLVKTFKEGLADMLDYLEQKKRVVFDRAPIEAEFGRLIENFEKTPIPK